MSYGAQIKFALGRQSAEGTAVTQPTSFHPFPLTGESTGLERDDLISANLTGRFEEGAIYDGPANVAGTIDFEVTARNLGASLAAAVNHAPATATSGSVKTYSFLPNTADFSSTLVKAPWTVYKQFVDASSAEHFYDCQFGQLSLTIAQRAFMRGQLTCNVGKRTVTGMGSASLIPDAADIGVLFPWNVASISYGGVAVLNYSELTVSLNEQIGAIFSLDGGLDPFKSTREGFRQISVNGTMYFNDRTALNNFTAGTQAQLLITLVNTRTAIQSGYYNTFIIDVPQLRLTQFKPAASGPGEVAVPITGRGVVDPSSSYGIKYTLQNTYGAGY